MKCEGIKPIVPLFAVVILGAGCATTKQARSVEPPKGDASLLGEDRALLQKGTENQPLLRYENPAADWSSYTKAIVTPARFEKPEGASASDLEDLQKLTDAMYAVLVEQLGHVVEIVTEPGPGTLRIDAAIYDAQKKQTGLNLISGALPVGIAVNAVVVAARGKSLAVGELSGEMKITDTMTGELIAAAVDRRVGRKYQSAAFQSWGEAYDAMEYWAKQTRHAICTRKGMADCPEP
jgi:hypothetical protein